MSTIIARAYLSPTLILLAIDWPEGETRKDFLGFAIKRTPGFRDFKTRKQEKSSWLPNRINFNGPPPPGKPDFPSEEAPIQKFNWWDSRVDEEDRGAKFTYEFWPVVGTKTKHSLVKKAKSTIEVVLPKHEENGIGTYFNRAVVSSQSFSRKLKALGIDKNNPPTQKQATYLRTWLANDLELVIPQFLKNSRELAGAIYHLTDNEWVIPAFRDFAQAKKAAICYDAKPTGSGAKKKPTCNKDVVDELGDKIIFSPRDKTSIMHNKFLVAGPSVIGGDDPRTLLCGSANFTTSGLTTQANLLHTFDSPALAQYYLERYRIIKDNPTKGETAAHNTGWSDMVTVGDAGIRVYFSPESGKQRESIDTIVRAIHAARSSVLFCLFCPTDEELRQACFAAGDNGKMMFGLVNNISEPDPNADPETMYADELANMELYHRSKEKRDVIEAAYFNATKLPAGFELEYRLFPGEKAPGYAPVIIHHKFIVIDAETENPIIYSGSANMSKNSVNNNDENLLEIVGSRRLASTYLAEFMRLYEHYRARANDIKFKKGTDKETYKLSKDSSWAAKYYIVGSPEYKSRVNMSKP
jgi:phosphatidylserine/phosphatidylglycerophosphate/cardiolipin synthase-like enzyme